MVDPLQEFSLALLRGLLLLARGLGLALLVGPLLAEVLRLALLRWAGRWRETWACRCWVTRPLAQGLILPADLGPLLALLGDLPLLPLGGRDAVRMGGPELGRVDDRAAGAGPVGR